MHKKLLYLFAIMAAILISGGTKAQAQLDGTVQAKVPFDFHASGTLLPAGTYTIRSIDSANQDVLEIQSANGKKSAILETQDSSVADGTKNNQLIFDKTGDDYVLTQIVDADDASGIDVANPHYSSKPATGRRILGFIHI